MKVGDRVLVGSYKVKPFDPSTATRGLIKDMKWNLVYVRFEDGRQEWVDSKWVHSDAR